MSARQKIFKIKVNSTYRYLQIFNGILQLTDMELRVLSEFVNAYLVIKKRRLNINPFCTEVKRQVAKRLGRNDFNTLNTYIKRLKDKKCIKETKDGYEIRAVLIPTGEKEVIFEFIN